METQELLESNIITAEKKAPAEPKKRGPFFSNHARRLDGFSLAVSHYLLCSLHFLLQITSSKAKPPSTLSLSPQVREKDEKDDEEKSETFTAMRAACAKQQ